ncbi:MAG: hypothetical protein ACI8ZB_000711 [Desulforhopalus sp.]|jgi:hypothetical protein
MNTPSLELIRILHATARLGTIEKNADHSNKTTQITFFKIPHFLSSDPVIAISFFIVKRSPIKYFHCISDTFPPDVPPPRQLPC